ncbi:MAG TPA: glycosyltransferase [Caldilinea sp.]|nr:glycosyltransferase [Caldilinea sp.]
MRVLNLVHQYLPEFVGGVELYTQSLAHELVRRNWEVGVFYRSYRDADALTVGSENGGSESAGSESGDGGNVVTFAAAAGALAPTSRFLATWWQPTLHAHWLAALEQFPPDLVHVQHLMGLPVSLFDVLHTRRIPYVVTLHDYWWQCANANLLTNYDATPCDGPQAYLNCTRCAVARAGSTAAWGAAPLLWGVLADRNRRLHPLLASAAALLTPCRAPCPCAPVLVPVSAC